MTTENRSLRHARAVRSPMAIDATCSATPARSSRASSTRSRDYPDLKYILTLQESVAVGDGRRLRPRDQAADASSSFTARRARQRHRHDLPGQARPRAAGGASAATRASSTRRWTRRWRPTWSRMARPVTKWSTRVVDPSSLLRVLRRAIKIAATPPMGPVFVCLPMDVLDAPNDEAVVPTSFPTTRVAAGRRSWSSGAADMLAGAPSARSSSSATAWRSPDAQAELAARRRAARRRGLGRERVARSTSRYTHPLFRGQLGHMFGDAQPPDHRAGGRGADRRHVRLPGGLPGARGRLRRGAPVDPRRPERLRDRQEPPGRPRARRRPEADAGGARRRARARDDAGSSRRRGRARREQAAPKRARRPRRQLAARPRVRRRRAAARLALHRGAGAARCPTTSIIFDEALTTSPELTRYLPPTHAGPLLPDARRLARRRHPGRASGVKLAHPGQDRDRLHRRRRQHVHDPGALDGGAPQHRRQVRRSATTAATSC